MSTAGNPSCERFASHSDDVYAWAYRILGCHEDALDVVQDVFLRWHRQCLGSEPVEPKGWLRRVTVNRAIDFHRSNTARRTGIRSVAAAPASPPAAPPEGIRSALIAAIERLSDMQRFVLAAKVFDDATFHRIAAEVGISESTAKTHFVRAVRAVRHHLEQKT